MSERGAAGIPAEPEARPSVLEPALWQRLQAAEGLPEAAEAWLALQARWLGASAACLLQAPGLSPLASLGPDAAALRAAAAAALDETRPVVQEAEEGPPRAVLALPLSAEGAAFAVAAFALPGRERDEWRGAIRQVQWGAAWLVAKRGEARAREERQGLARARAALDLLAGVLEQARFRAACMAAATDLAIAFSCQRVAIGFLRRGVARIAGISHTAQFGREMNLVRRLGACMNEAVDQRSLILFPPPPGEGFVTTAHAELARLQHDGRVLSVPLLVEDRFVGAVTLERPGERPFLPETIGLIAATCAAVGPVLEAKRQNDRWLVVKAGDAAAGLARRIVGPNRTGLKLALAGLGVLALALSLVEAEYRVTADARVEGLVRRSVVASYDGYLKAAQVRAGDTVRQGDLLASLEDRDLALERLRWVTERQQRTYEYDKALATRQPATINVVKSQIEQAEAQIRLLDEQLARARFVAPFDGLIVSGDLSQAIGGAIGRGQVLFEIAPLDAYRVVLSVDERLIADLRAGQRGQMLASSLPEEPQALTVQTITPVAEARNGRNLFRVEG
ncbi:multidrug resistance efflux pump, partial [Methylobacterium sp. BE186]|uniref:HlyD family efflux transporter periplasmic adaptor subunit n=1 Tax=Methylobacterium sp. BE186 TaxID=2817715 RepID=UPI002854DCB8